MTKPAFMINNFSRKNGRISRNILFSAAVFLALGAVIFASFAYFSRNSNAALAGFDPGNIIDDATMANKNSMSENDIQNFLNAQFSGNYKDGSPNGYGVAAYPGYQYHVENGHFVPLADEHFGNNGLPATGGQSSAHIIWQAAQDYSINPQVLLVILQKEQGIITDNWPNYTQYQSATGFGCPDTAACDPNYGGFIAQVRNAAAFFREVLDGGWSNYPVGNNYVQYNPNPACGGSVINIQNRATSALYRYTPYQPNASALAAGWGTGDACGAYGNRNFYNYFTEWFGSTHGSTEKTFLPNGSYYIVASSNPNSALGFANNSADGSALAIFAKTSDATLVNISRNSDGTYLIKNPANNLVWDVPGGNATVGLNIQQHSTNGSTAQSWNLRNNSDGTYTFSSKLSDYLVIDLPGNSTANGVIPQLYYPNDSAAQKFYIVPKSQVVANGQYYFASNINSISNLDVAGGNSANGTNVDIFRENYSAAQKWNLQYNQNTGYYSVINASGKALDVAGGNSANATNVDIYDQNGTCAQNWRVFANSNNTFSLLSSCSGKALDVAGGHSADFTNVDIYEYNGTNAQNWIFRPINSPQEIANGTYTISSSLNSRKVLDVAGGNSADKTPVQIYDFNNSGAQKWQISFNQNTGKYTFINTNSGKALDVLGADTNLAAKLDIYTGNGTCAQNFYANKQADGSFEILSGCSGLALDLSGGSVANGNKIQLYSRNFSGAQKWNFTLTQ